MVKGLKVLICLYCCLLLSPAQAQFKTWPVVNLFFKNQFDKNGFHHGRWAFFTDAVGENEKMKTKGRYHHGSMVGKWKTFSSDKKLRKVENSRLSNGSNLIETVEYYANGKIARKGVSVFDRTGKTPRLYLKDEWQYFTEDGSKDRTVFYEEGWPVKTTYADGKVVLSKAPPKAVVYKKGEKPNEKRPRTGITMMRKDGNLIEIRYHENGDSTVTVTPIKVSQ